MIQSKVVVSFPDYCPKCSHKLYHVNALDTEARIYFVWCPDYRCRWCCEFEKTEEGDITKCL